MRRKRKIKRESLIWDEGFEAKGSSKKKKQGRLIYP